MIFATSASDRYTTLQRVTQINSGRDYSELKKVSSLEAIPEIFQSEDPFPEAFEVVKQMNWSQVELDTYLDIGIRIYDHKNALETARLKGEELGKEQGEAKKAPEIARALIGKIPDAEIAQTTGLSLD